MQNMNVAKIYLFHADWCRSCPGMVRIFRKVEAEEKDASIKFYDIDVETDLGVELTTKHQVRNVPTILVIKGGRVIERVGGTIKEEEFKSLVRKWK